MIQTISPLCHITLEVLLFGDSSLSMNTNTSIFTAVEKFMSGTFWDQNWADLVKFSVLQQNRIAYSNSIKGTLLSISSNWLGNKTFISCLFVVQSNYCPLVPWTTWYTIARGRRSSTAPRVIVYSYFMLVCSIVKLLLRRAVGDLMHYCTRLKAECNSVSGHPRYRGVIGWLYYKQAL